MRRDPLRILAFAAIAAAIACNPATDTQVDTPATPANIEIFVGDSQSSVVNAVLITPLSVVVKDAHGAAVSGATVTWTVDDGGGTVSAATSLTSSEGRASTIFTLGSTLGPQHVHASVTGVAAHAQFTAIAFPSQWSGLTPASAVIAGGNLQLGNAGLAVGHPLIVLVSDASGAPVSGVLVSWTGVGGATVTPASTITDAQGRAATVLTLGPNAGPGQGAQASVLGVSGSVGFAATAAGAPASIELATGIDQTGTINAVLGQPLGVRVRDAQGNLVPNALVTWSVTGGGGHIAPSTDVTGGVDGDLPGQANATWVLGATLGLQTATASIAGGHSVTFQATGVATAPTGAPILVASVVPPSGATYYHDTFVRDGLAFSCVWNQGVVIYDVGDGRAGGSPTNPRVISQIIINDNGVIGGPAAHNAWWFKNPVTHENRYLFVGQEGPMGVGTRSQGDIHIIDVSDLSHPVEVGFIHVPGAGSHNFWMDESKQILYSAFYNGGVAKIDVSGTLSGDMSNRIVARVQPGGPDNTYVWGVMLSGGTLYASDMVSGFWALDPNTLATKGGGFNMAPRPATDLWVFGNVAYTGTFPGGTAKGNVVKIWSLDAAGNPVIADSIVIPNVGAISDVAVTPDGKMLVVTTEGAPTGSAGLYVYDRTVNPLKPTLAGFYLVPPGLHTGTVSVIGGRTYVFAARDPSQVQMDIYDITDLVR